MKQTFSARRARGSLCLSSSLNKDGGAPRAANKEEEEISQNLGEEKKVKKKAVPFRKKRDLIAIDRSSIVEDSLPTSPPSPLRERRVEGGSERRR